MAKIAGVETKKDNKERPHTEDANRKNIMQTLIPSTVYCKHRQCEKAIGVGDGDNASL